MTLLLIRLFTVLTNFLKIFQQHRIYIRERKEIRLGESFYRHYNPRMNRVIRKVVKGKSNTARRLECVGSGLDRDEAEARK